MKPDPRALFPGSPPELAARIGAGRAAIAAGILAAPVASARFLGTDTATARRVSWLARMMAIRDGALGAGALLAARRDPAAAVPWLAAGAVCDAVDALVLADALRARRVRGVLPAVTVPVAAATAGAGLAIALRLRRN